MRHITLLLTLITLSTCTDETYQPPEPSADVPKPTQEPEPAREPAQLSAMQAPEPAVTMATEAYEGAENWCYEVDDLPPCRREGDGADEALPTTCTPDPRTGRTRICVDPWWVPGHGRVCVPRPLDSREREHARAELVAFVYRRVNGRHEGICQPQSWWRWGQGHEVDRGKCDPKRLSLLLAIVSWRETKHDRRKTHLMNPDKKAAAGAWKRKRHLYAESNPHYWAAYRWRSRGPYGTNPALHLWKWDRTAPPEVLCNRVIATETYLETMRGCHTKLRDLRGEDPDWWDLHHCASGGKLARPEVISTERGSFHQRATKVGLDPYEQVPIEWLGTPITHELSEVREIEEKIAAHLDNG